MINPVVRKTSMSSAIHHLRKEYTLQGLDIAEVSPNPIEQFNQWFKEAVSAGVAEPNAMHLSTAAANGHPSGRIVLLKDVTDEGFTFYTNYESRKGHELAANPHVALTFFYPDLERQIRIEGTAAPVSEAESDAYFNVRPRNSQIGAWASPQSLPIDSRQLLEERQQTFEHQFADKSVPRPPHWGGYRVRPDRIEFWQGRPGRLHDRICYERIDNGWHIERLAP